MKKTLAIFLSTLLLMLAISVPVMATNTAYAEPMTYAEEVEEPNCQPAGFMQRAVMGVLIYGIGVPFALAMAPIYWIGLYFHGLSQGNNWFTSFFTTGWESVAMQFRWMNAVYNFFISNSC